MLSLNEAAQLYVAMKPFLPLDRKAPPLDFMQQMVDNLIQSGSDDDYLTIISILEQVSPETVAEMLPAEIIPIFMRGMVDNKVYDLIDFFERLGL